MNIIGQTERASVLLCRQENGQLRVLDIEIGGFTPGLFDVLDISGTAYLGGGIIKFSLLDGYDIVTDVGPGETWELSFLHADVIDRFESVVSYDFIGLPSFQYNVFQREDDLIFQATNTVPLPGAVLLGMLGLSTAAWRLRKRGSA